MSSVSEKTTAHVPSGLHPRNETLLQKWGGKQVFVGNLLSLLTWSDITSLSSCCKWGLTDDDFLTRIKCIARTSKLNLETFFEYFFRMKRSLKAEVEDRESPLKQVSYFDLSFLDGPVHPGIKAQIEALKALITTKKLSVTLQCLPNIRTLRFPSFGCDRQIGALSSLRHCPKLEEFSMTSFHLDEVDETAIAACPNLTKLSYVSGAVMMGSLSKITSKVGLRTLTLECLSTPLSFPLKSQLEELSLRDCRLKVSKLSLITLHCRELRRLDLSGNTAIKTNDLIRLLKREKPWESLIFSGTSVDDQGLDAFVDYGVTHPTIYKTLPTLNISGTSISYNGLWKVVPKLPTTLQRLICSSAFITDELVRAVLTRCPSVELTYHNTELTDRGLTFVLRHGQKHPEIFGERRSLDLTGTKAPFAIYETPRHLPFLREFKCMGGITDGFIKELLGCCTKLSCLPSFFNSAITDEGLMLIIGYLEKRSEMIHKGFLLDLRNTDVTPKALALIPQRLPHVRFVFNPSLLDDSLLEVILRFATPPYIQTLSRTSITDRGLEHYLDYGNSHPSFDISRIDVRGTRVTAVGTSRLRDEGKLKRVNVLLS